MNGKHDRLSTFFLHVPGVYAGLVEMKNNEIHPLFPGEG
jgi:hypothetical protein